MQTKTKKHNIDCNFHNEFVQESFDELKKKLINYNFLIGIKCKCDKGHEWNVACATIWTQMPWCPECQESQNGNLGRPAVSFMGLYEKSLKKHMK